jgi:flagellar biosynthetic protein FlhB
MSDKTEAPTGRKIADARDKGMIARSHEVNVAAGMLAAFWLLQNTTGQLALTLSGLMRNTFVALPTGGLSLSNVNALLFNAAWQAALVIGPFMLTMGAVGVIATLVQTRGLFNTSAISLNIGRLNPLPGFQKLFSPQSLVELFKALLKVAIIGWVAYGRVQIHLPRLLNLGTTDMSNAIGALAAAVFDLGTQTAFAYLVIAGVDYFYQYRRWYNSLKMSKQEVMDEFKRSEGDPKLRGRIRQQQRQMARQRMMENVPKANVVLINPTHLAVALQYDRNKMGAPRVVAKGAMLIAERIVEIARSNGIPVIQNIPLARALYAGVKIDQEIPAALYQAVAEVLAFVFSLKQRSVLRTQSIPATILQK